MELRLSYENSNGIRSVCFYQTFFRNKDLRDSLINYYFNEKNIKQNIKILKERFEEYSISNKIPMQQRKDFAKYYLCKDGIDEALTPSILSAYFDLSIVQFMSNIFHNMIDIYFNNDAIKLALFFNTLEETDAFIIPTEEISEWVSLLNQYQSVELCPPISHHAYQRKIPKPLKSLFNDFNNEKIKNKEIVFRTEQFFYNEEDFEESNEKEGLSEFEFIKSNIKSANSEPYVKLKDALELSVYENDTVKKMIVN